MTITIKDITITDMLQADVDNGLIHEMSFPYDKVNELLDAKLELENVSYSVANQFENGEEYFIINTSYGRLKLNTKYFHSIIIE